MLIIEGDFPVSVELDDPHDPAFAADGLAHSNLQLLRALNVLELGGYALPEKTPDSTGELARVEAKLDLVLTMLGEWLAAQKPLPAAGRVWLSVERMRVALPAPLPAGRRVRVELYPSARLPRPLRFRCHTGSATPDGPAAPTDLVIDWSNTAALDEFERYIFLLSRRQQPRKDPHES